MSAVLDAAKNAYFDMKWQLRPQQANGGHKGTVLAVAFFQDSRRVVTGSKDHTLRIWDVERKQNVFGPLVKHTDLIRSVCFSPDGKRVASGSYDETVVVWSAETGAVVATLKGHRSLVLTVAFSPDGVKVASGSWDRTIRVWGIDNAELLFEIDAHQDWVRSVVWLPGGQQLVSASDDKTVKFWDASTGHQIGQPCIGPTRAVESLAIPSDGSFIATASRDGTVRLLSTNTRQEIGQVDKLTQCIAISPNGTLLVCSSDPEGVRLWSIKEMLKRNAGQEIWLEQTQHIAGSVRVYFPPSCIAPQVSESLPRYSHPSRWDKP